MASRIFSKRHPGPDAWIGVTESGKSVIGLVFALLVFAIIAVSFVLTTR